MCQSGPPMSPEEAEYHQATRQLRRSLDALDDSERAEGRAGLADWWNLFRSHLPRPLIGARSSMCKHDDRPPGDQKVDRTGHEALARWQGPPPGWPFAALLVLVSLACAVKDPPDGPPEHGPRGFGNFDPSKAPPPPRNWFQAPEWLTSAGMYSLRRYGLRAWFRWTFLELDRHEADCKWVAFLRWRPGRRLVA